MSFESGRKGVTQMEFVISEETRARILSVNPCKPLRDTGCNGLVGPVDPKTERLLRAQAERIWFLLYEADSKPTQMEGRDVEREASRIAGEPFTVPEGTARVIKVLLDGVLRIQK